MDTRHSVAVVTPKSAATEVSKKASSACSGADSFAEMLQSVQPEVEGSLLSSIMPAGADARKLLQSDVTGMEVLALAAQQAAEDVKDLGIDSVQGLLGQLQGAAVLDVQEGDISTADMASGKSSFFSGHGRWNGLQAQLPTAVGHNVSIVASGVQAASMLVPTDAMSASVAGYAADGVAETLVGAISPTEEDVAPKDGRFALDSNWIQQDKDVELPAPIQRLFGHVEQWVASTSMHRRKADVTSDAAAASAETTGVQADGASSSGTRLMENAVTEMKQAHSADADATPESAFQDMRFWLQGKQQRAEIVIDRSGQPIRVQVHVAGNEAHVTLRTSEQQTREMLDSGLEQLRAALQQQGIALGEVTVEADAQPKSGSQAQDERPLWATEESAQHASVLMPEPDVGGTGMRRSAQVLDFYA